MGVQEVLLLRMLNDLQASEWQPFLLARRKALYHITHNGHEDDRMIACWRRAFTDFAPVGASCSNCLLVFDFYMLYPELAIRGNTRFVARILPISLCIVRCKSFRKMY